jgi:hypothetical protein
MSTYILTASIVLLLVGLFTFFVARSKKCPTCKRFSLRCVWSATDVPTEFRRCRNCSARWMSSWNDRKLRDASDAKYDWFFSDPVMSAPTDENPHPCPACGNRLEECMVIHDDAPQCRVCGLILSSTFQAFPWLKDAVVSAQRQ